MQKLNRFMKKFIALLGFLASLMTGFSQKANHKIVFQLVSGDSTVHKMLINNLHNIKEEWGERVSIEVVLHGPGVSFAFKSKKDLENDINNLMGQGIVFLVCENTLKQKKIDKALIRDKMIFVKLGIGHLVERQEKGWSYIKAGF